ncbi:MAG: hypothetical protein LRS43_00305 [Desulfurococcales archaeon]|nr:hypothetical protein [Desulfurococcales archaeon]
MPTVHLSLPDNVYQELRRRSGELGIQITDLIKLYIKLGIDRGFSQQSHVDKESLEVLARKVDRLEKDVRVKTAIVEGKYRQLEETLNYILERIELLEDMVSENRAKRRVAISDLEEKVAGDYT